MDEMCFTVDFSTPTPAQLAQEQRQRRQELQRQQLERLRRIEKPPTAPAIDGVLWSQYRPPLGMHDVPILSILKFVLRPEVDMQDVTSAPRKLWAVVLRYIRSMSDCLFLRWGATQADEHTIFCFIQWKSSSAWQEFQKSPGFHPMAVFLASSVWNRQFKVQTYVIGDATRQTQMVITSFGASVADDEKRAFGQEFRSHFGSICLCSGWLEYNAVVPAQHTAAQAVSAQTPTIFCSLLEADGSMEPFSDAHFTAMASVRRETHLHWIKFTEDAAHAAPVVPLPSLPGDSIAWICDRDLLRHAAGLCFKNTYDERFPGPQASHCSQGDLNEDRKLSELPDIISPPCDSLLTIVWIRLHEIARAGTVFDGFNRELARLEGYKAAAWALDHERDLIIAILIMWDVDQASSERCYATLDSLAQVSPEIDQTWVLEHRSMPASLELMHMYTCMEINTFQVPNDPRNHSLFKSAARQWKSSMVAYRQSGHSDPGACYEEAAGGWHPTADENGMLHYTCVVRWESPATRAEWYASLYNAPYATFGLNLDALNIGASGGIQSRLLLLQSQYRRCSV